MRLSSANIMALQSDLCFIRCYIRELEAKKETWKSKLARMFMKYRAEDMNFKINNLHALVHVFSKTLEVARKINKNEEDEEELFFSLLDLCESIKDEIAIPEFHSPEFIQILENLNSRFDDNLWEKISSCVDKVRSQSLKDLPFESGL